MNDEPRNPSPGGIPHHSSMARSTPGQQAWKWFRTFRWHLLLLFLSDYGRDIVYRKYDAFTTDRAYENRPSGRWLVGRLIDRLVLRQDTHVGLRQRLAIVVDELSTTSRVRRAETGASVRVASGPCGLARDLRNTWARLEHSGDRPGEWLELTGLDLDFSNEVLPAASRLATEAGVPLSVFRQDLLDAALLEQALGVVGVDVFLSMGLTVWLSPDDRMSFLRGIRRVLAPRGYFIVDNFHQHASSRYLNDFEMRAWYPSDEEFEGNLDAAGFQLKNKRETRNGVNVVYTAQRRD